MEYKKKRKTERNVGRKRPKTNREIWNTRRNERGKKCREKEA